MPENFENKNNEENLDEPISAIKRADNFEELFKAIKERGGVIGGNNKKYTAEMIKEIVESITEEMGFIAPEARDKRNFTENTDLMKNFTRNEGLRDKVRELFLKMYWPERKEGSKDAGS